MIRATVQARLVLTVLLAALASPSPARAEDAVQLTTERWHPGARPFDLHWELLDLPGRVVQLAFAPLEPLFHLVEKKRLDRRLYDLVSNDARTAFLLPYLTVGGTDGVGGGVFFLHNDLFGEDERLRFTGVLRGNLDYKLKTTYEQSVARLDGRKVRVRLSYDVDSDFRFLGVGGDTPASQERAVRSEELLVDLRAQLLGPQLLYVSSDLSLVYRRETLGPGTHPDIPSMRVGDAQLAPPPGFGQTLDIPELTLYVTVDSRDSLGRTTQGLWARLAFTAMRDLNGADLSAVRAVLDTALFLEVLPRSRVLVLSAGLGAAVPWQREHRLPLHGLVSLGRETHLRGYKRDRFLDALGWWAGVEYRYPIHEHEFEEMGVSTVIFVDVGRAGDDLNSLFGERPRWSAGFGVHADTAIFSILRLLVGFSPEGNEVTLSLGGGFL